MFWPRRDLEQRMRNSPSRSYYHRFGDQRGGSTATSSSSVSTTRAVRPSPNRGRRKKESSLSNTAPAPFWTGANASAAATAGSHKKKTVAPMAKPARRASVSAGCHGVGVGCHVSRPRTFREDELSSYLKGGWQPNQGQGSSLNVTLGGSHQTGLSLGNSSGGRTFTLDQSNQSI